MAIAPELRPDGLNGLRALMASQNSLNLAGLTVRHPRLVARLAKFSFPDVAAMVGGLLTLPENQPATYRLEVMNALAAIHCRGRQVPTLAQLREWLNDILLPDPVGQFEDPVEDVFLSNVPSWHGNARLFDGLWADNDAGVQVLVAALTQLKDQSWAATALSECMALLQLSEAIAERTGLDRYTLSQGVAKAPIRVVSSLVNSGRAHVTFSDGELAALGLGPRRLGAFVLTRAHIEALPGQTIGHTLLERHPLIPANRALIVAQPTALGAAIRRHAIEAAHAAGALDRLSAAVVRDQIQTLRHFMLQRLNIVVVRGPEEVDGGITDIVGRFDEGGYVHLVYVADALEQVRDNGLLSMHDILGLIDARAGAVAAECGKQPDYQRGLTLVVHGGVGRPFAAGFGEPPAAWHYVIFSHAELDRLCWDHGFDALRIWKITDQEDQLPKRGYVLDNINGFPNLYGFMFNQEMALVPSAAAPGMLGLGTDFVTEVRHRLRTALDQHVAMSANRSRWVELQRPVTEVYFREARDLPLFVSRADMAANGTLLACVETQVRPWWIETKRGGESEQGRLLHFHLWEMAHNWLLRAVPCFERHLSAIPEGPIGFRIVADGADDYDPATAFAGTEPVAPGVAVVGAEIVIDCSNLYIAAFGRPDNIGDRMMIAAMAAGLRQLVAAPPNPAGDAALALEIAGGTDARFFHMRPPTTPSELIQSATTMPRARLVQGEDLAWSRLGLAVDSDWTKGEGAVPEAEAPKLLNKTVDVLWKRIAARLREIGRESLIVRLLANHDAIEKDRSVWNQTAAALLSLYEDAGDVVQAANRLEGLRGLSGLSGRIVAEMALCTCPVKGRAASDADLDALVADVAALLECANESDALRWRLAASPPVVYPNGGLGYDRTFGEAEHRPYLEAHGERSFRDAAGSYAKAFEKADGAGKGIDPAFEAAMVDEFGITLTDLAGFAIELAQDAAAAGEHLLLLPRSEIEARLAGGTRGAAVDAAKAFDKLALKPRPRWDEPNPTGAEQRDWYPWRFNRRLSLLHRPFVQFNAAADPSVLVLPTMVDRTVQRLFGNLHGRLPATLYDSPLLQAWIGGAVNLEGHRFNKIVAEHMRSLGFEARSDLDMTVLGGTKAMGDVDVLAWHAASGLVLAIECKRLHFARSTGEIGERLAEYTEIAASGETRTPIQKHLDRLAYLGRTEDRLAQFTSIDEASLTLRSALVTDYLVPMQFSRRAMAMVDLVADVQTLDDAIGRMLALALNGRLPRANL